MKLGSVWKVWRYLIFFCGWAALAAIGFHGVRVGTISTWEAAIVETAYIVIGSCLLAWYGERGGRA